MDERINKSENMSNYYNIGLGYQSESQHASDNEANSTTKNKMEQFQNKFLKPIFQKKNKLNYELQGKIGNDQL